ncbi:PfWMP4_15 [Phormidium phage Pf-WMP4]|uniref:PfWMP4_15 n=1 Tax=Phormidium phage Pf-WMP4 TaxID=2913979 RepID=Q0GBV1_9CAUD|nr:PfWMP4_15 [Phormidium phage Pf-WMP4]ABI33159.1 PfWMP4_15 [Phormidium phage Pf-WMP4]
MTKNLKAVVERYPEFNLKPATDEPNTFYGEMRVGEYKVIITVQGQDFPPMVDVRFKCKSYGVGCVVHPHEPPEYIDEMLYQQLKSLMIRALQIPLLGKMGG